jgi:formimidoylglutamate deiminase
LPEATAALFAERALLPQGWVGDVRIDLTPDGGIAAVTADGDPAGTERLDGVALPGMPNLHSHAFQRAMAGLAERAGRRPDGTPDSFWTWREVVYGFVAQLTPDDVRAIAAQLYVEMLCAGYTAVGEFHYLHHDAQGRPYTPRTVMADAIVDAARGTGIGLTLLPVLYCTGDFGDAPPAAGQRRYVNTAEDFGRLVGDLAGQHAGDPGIRVGIAPHSLRAVPPAALDQAIAALDAIDPTAPIHIHIAEQQREVDDCLAWSSQRPVEWLLAHQPVDARWCLVHATHMTDAETQVLAKSDAVAGLCPTTEANLGDGLFPFVDFIGSGGRFGIGSDSHVSVSPVEELRWLEYGQRLHRQSRNLTTAADTASTGAALYRAALAGGAQALGRPIGALAPGHRADIVVVDPDHPQLAGRSDDLLLDALVFSGNANPVRHVMSGGRWQVRDGRHRDQDAVAAAYRTCVARLR